MSSISRLVCLLLLYSLNIGSARSTTKSPLTDSLSKAQDTFLKAQGTFIRGYAGELIDGSLNELKFRLATLQTEVEKLIHASNARSSESELCISAMNNLTIASSAMENRLRSLYMEFEKHNIFESRIILLRDIIADIRNRRYKLAYEKLFELGDIAAIPKIVHEVYADSEQNLQYVSTFAAAASNSTHCFAVLKALKEEISMSNQNKTFYLIHLANIVEKELLNCNSNDTNFRVDLDRQIEIAAVDTLVASMKSGDFSSNETVRELINVLKSLRGFRPEVSDNIMTQLVDGVFGIVDHRAIISNVLNRCDTPQAVPVLTQLFWKIKDGGFYNDSQLIIDISSNLSVLSNKVDFLDLSIEIKSSYDKVLGSIPKCAKNVLFEKSVCLWNKAKDVYLQAVSDEFKYDGGRRRILTTAASKDIPKGAAWIPIKQGDDILFRSKEYPNEFLYYADFEYNSQMRFVFSRIVGNIMNSQSSFKIQLLNDESCYLKSSRYNEYLFASDVKFEKDENYSYPFAWKAGSAGGLDSAFAWQIIAC